jgi:multicomponent Na+:H+ antiporter subunit G
MIIDIASWILLLAGSALGIVGGIGIHGFPDFYSRLHAAGITDTLCTMLILLGLGLQAGWSIAAFKLALIFVFLFFTRVPLFYQPNRFPCVGKRGAAQRSEAQAG